MKQRSNTVSEGEQFSTRLDHEMLEFRLAVIQRVCAVRGMKVSRDDCETALVAGDGNLLATVSHISKRWQVRWSRHRVMFIIKRALGIK